MRFVAVVGNPRPVSHTLAVASAAAEAVSRAAGLADDATVIDLCRLARKLLLDEPCAAVEDALDQVTGADLVLVASPTIKGSYTGLLKVFLDRLPHRGLDGAVALPLLVMRTPQHAMAVDVYLRPLLVELGASAPTPGLAVLEADFPHLDLIVAPWAARVAAALAGPVPALAR